MKRLLFFALLFSITLFAHNDDYKKPTDVLPISNLNGKDVQITFNNFGEYPDICQDKDDNVWVVYSEYLHGIENIILKKINNMSVQDSVIVNATSEGFEHRPRILSKSDDSIFIVWCAKRNNNWDIYARSYSDGKLSDEIRVTKNSAADLNPSVTSDPAGNTWIAWETLRNNNFDIYAKKIADDKISEPINISNSNDMELRPYIKYLNDNLYIVWDRQHEENYQIILKSFDGKKWSSEEKLSPDKGFNLAPTLSVSKDNKITAAWHSNLQPDGRVGFTPWVYYKNLNGDDSNIFYTTADESDWFKKGEDQAFEFPSLLYDKNNVLWIFGRPSQGFYVQCVKDNHHSPLYQLNVDGWGGRGQYAQPILGNDGFIYSIRRDIKYIYLNRFSTDISNLDVDYEVQQVNFDDKKLIAFPIQVNDDDTKLKLPDDMQIVYGDIHQHSSLSDGRGTIDQCYTRSRYILHYDFAALTDHEWFTANLLTPSEWDRIKIIGQQFYEPGKFITYAAYEWTTPRLPKGFGHKNVFFLDWNKPIFSFDSTASTTKNLFKLLKENNAIAIPHHIGWTGTDWENHDPEVQPDVEIVSTHGAFEYMGNEPIRHRGGMPGNFVQDGLERGLKFGLIGSSDGHGLRFHHGVGRKDNEWQTGLTGVIVKNKTKEEIFNSLKERRVFATSGTKIQVSFKINDAWMGEEVISKTPPKIKFEVLGSSKIKYAILVRDNKNLLYLGKDLHEGRGVRTEYIDKDLSVGEHWYYIRLIQDNGEMAWSSPIWVNYNP